MKIVNSVIERYRELISLAGRSLEGERPSNGDFHLPYALPEPDRAWSAYFGASDVGFGRLGLSREHDVILLDLMGHAATRTAKTFGSLTMVARAIGHTRATGEPVAFVTASSGNKATALRDAVRRAYDQGLASPSTLRILTLLPTASRGKLRGSALSHRRNPVFLVDVPVPDQVKNEAQWLLSALSDSTPWRLCASADLDNYRLADTVRAFVEAEFFPIAAASPPRWHVHAVSSGYGFLGYELGHQILRGPTRLPSPAAHPAFLVVQQPAASDLVDGILRTNGSGRARYPLGLQDPDEVIDPTFYSSRPATAGTLVALTTRHGGDGIVVSKAECAAFYDRHRELLSNFLYDVPEKVDDLREWSLVMTLTGLSKALEQGIIATGSEVVVHGTGSYTDRLLPPMRPREQIRVRDRAELRALALRALAVTS